MIKLTANSFFYLPISGLKDSQKGVMKK